MGDDAAVECLPAGAEKIIEWFGRWPSFHDAEIVSFYLARSGPSLLRIYPYFPEKPATVGFVLEDIVDLELFQFSPQNVVFGLIMKKTKNEGGETIFRLELFPCFGLAGKIDAKSVRVELIPGKSPDGVSLW